MIVTYRQVSVTSNEVSSYGHGITKNTNSRIECCIGVGIVDTVSLIEDNTSRIPTLKFDWLVTQPKRDNLSMHQINFLFCLENDFNHLIETPPIVMSPAVVGMEWVSIISKSVFLGIFQSFNFNYFNSQWYLQSSSMENAKFVAEIVFV